MQLEFALDAEDFKQFNEISEQQHDLIRKLYSDSTLHETDDMKLFMQTLIERTTTQIEKIEQRKSRLREKGLIFCVSKMDTIRESWKSLLFVA